MKNMKKSSVLSFVLGLCLVVPGYAQLGAPASGGGGSQGLQLPLSGRSAQGGSATATQTAIPGTTTSVNTLNIGVSVQGPYAGSTTTGSAVFSGKLTLAEAVQRALAHNMAATGLAGAVRQARGQERSSRSVLMPNLNGAIRDNYFTQDLQALGIKIPNLPAVIGPTNYFDLRVTLTQSFADLTAINNHRATQEIVKANEQAVKDARETIVLATGGAYLQVIAAKARVESAKAQLQTAKALYEQTKQRREGGLVAQIDVNRSLVQQKTQTQRIATLENDLARQKINLARIAGLPANDQYDISDSFDDSPAPQLAVEEAVKQALEAREDLKSAESQVRAAERTRAAAKAERLPSIGISADIGAIGPRVSQVEHTYTVVGSIRIPIWQGGKAAGDLEQAEAVLGQRRAEVDDTRGRIESDVRNAFLDLQAAASQLELAKQNQELARETLRLTKTKFEAGISESLEVTQAEEAVASSDLDRITSLFAYNLAKLSLARGLGQAEARLGDFLKVSGR